MVNPVAAVPITVQVMTKGSLDAVTRALTMEYANEGIRVNTVALSVIKTLMHKPVTYELLKGLHPIGRMGEIKEVVDAVLFLTDATCSGRLTVRFCRQFERTRGGRHPHGSHNPTHQQSERSARIRVRTAYR